MPYGQRQPNEPRDPCYRISRTGRRVQKKTYPTLAAARAAVTPGMIAYPCESCGKFHLGHRTRGKSR